MFEDWSELTSELRNGTFYFIVFVLLFGNLAMCDSAIQIQRLVWICFLNFFIKKITQINLAQVQYEVNGVQYGSKSSGINMEAKPYNEIRARSCVMTK